LVVVFSNFDNSSKESIIITHQSKVAATGDAIIIFADGVNAADIIRIFVAMSHHGHASDFRKLK
jgi:hypothetical protein